MVQGHTPSAPAHSLPLNCFGLNLTLCAYCVYVFVCCVCVMCMCACVCVYVCVCDKVCAGGSCQRSVRSELPFFVGPCYPYCCGLKHCKTHNPPEVLFEPLCLPRFSWPRQHAFLPPGSWYRFHLFLHRVGRGEVSNRTKRDDSS
jgi:hypothetical protein